MSEEKEKESQNAEERNKTGGGGRRMQEGKNVSGEDGWREEIK